MYWNERENKASIQTTSIVSRIERTENDTAEKDEMETRGRQKHPKRPIEIENETEIDVDLPSEIAIDMSLIKSLAIEIEIEIEINNDLEIKTNDEGLKTTF